MCDDRRKKGPDLSQSILEDIGNASISLFNRQARRSFLPVTRKRPITTVGIDGTPSPPKRSRRPRSCSPHSSSVVRDELDADINVDHDRHIISYDFFDLPLRRCHVEDLFELAPDTPLLLLVPEDVFEYDYFLNMANGQKVRDKVHINGRQFLQLDCVVLSNPKLHTILPLMQPNYSTSLIRDLYLQDEGLNFIYSRRMRLGSCPRHSCRSPHFL